LIDFLNYWAKDLFPARYVLPLEPFSISFQEN
jgi:hypothetical protein